MLSKKRKITLLGSATIVLLIIWGVNRAYFGPPLIRIINNSRFELTDIVLSGDKFVKGVGRIQPTASVTVMVRPPGESGLLMEFVANGRRVAKDDLAYIEAGGGYCVTIVIDEHLNIETTDEHISCFSVQRLVL